MLERFRDATGGLPPLFWSLWAGMLVNRLASFVITFLASLSGDIYRPAAQAAIADIVPAADRARAYGLVYWAINLGWAISLSVAGFVAERSMLALFLADAATSIGFAAIVFARVPETRPADLPVTPTLPGLRRIAGDGPFLVFLGLHLVVLLVFTQFQLAAPLDYAAHGVGPRGFSLIMALNGVGVVVLQPLLSPRLPRHDGARVLALSSLLIGLGFGLNAFGGSIPAYLAGALLYTLGEVLGFPVASAIVADLAPPDLRGRYQGAFSMAWGLAFTLSPLLGGEVLHRFGGVTLWLGCLAVGAGAALLHLAAGPARRRRLAQVSHAMVGPR